MPERNQVVNFGAGPSPLPTSVLEEATKGLLNYKSTGIGLTELSHRSSTYRELNLSTQKSLRQLLTIPDEFEVLFMQGGGVTQFAAAVLNLVAVHRLKHKTPPQSKVAAGYVITGSWSAKAAAEATRLGVEVDVVIDSRKSSSGGKSFVAIPPASQWNFKSESPAFLYFCDNETVNGVEFQSPGFPVTELPSHWRDVPLVADMSSNILSRSIPKELWSRLGVVYAGAQKNMGPAGVTVVIVRKDLLVDLDEAVQYGGDRVPSILSYKITADNESLFNTPPMFSVYVCSLIYEQLLANGGVQPIELVNRQKADAVYGVLDTSQGFYQPIVEKAARSRMNIVFLLRGGKEVEAKFIEAAEQDGIVQIKGHRSMGGIRASLYNAVTLEHVQKLCAFMERFAAQST